MAATEEEQTKGKEVLKFKHLSVYYCTSMHLRECCIGIIWKTTQRILNDPIL